jgi:hypothetical protein
MDALTSCKQAIAWVKSRSSQHVQSKNLSTAVNAAADAYISQRTLSETPKAKKSSKK